jgi:SH3 domain-binding protein 5 (SH3BP5)
LFYADNKKKSITDPNSPLSLIIFPFAITQEANATFRILLNESTRRLKVSAKKLGSSIDKSRPYHEAVEKARIAQIECQKAAAKFQRANGKRSLIINSVNN